MLLALSSSRLRTLAAIPVTIGALAVVMGGVMHQDHATGEPLRAPQAQGGAETSGSIPFRMVGLSADDLVAVSGLDLYKYQVDMPKGQRFRVMIRELKSEDSPARVLYVFPFQKTEDGPTTFRVCFLRRDHTLQGVLLSQEKDAEFRFDCPGCTPSGIATFVELPLGSIEPTRKTLETHRSHKDNDRYRLEETRLLTIVASEPGKPAPPPTNYPRAELVIVKDQ
jgi:hypothetical protein